MRWQWRKRLMRICEKKVENIFRRFLFKRLIKYLNSCYFCQIDIEQQLSFKLQKSQKSQILPIKLQILINSKANKNNIIKKSINLNMQIKIKNNLFLYKLQSNLKFIISCILIGIILLISSVYIFTIKHKNSIISNRFLQNCQNIVANSIITDNNIINTQIILKKGQKMPVSSFSFSPIQNWYQKQIIQFVIQQQWQQLSQLKKNLVKITANQLPTQKQQHNQLQENNINTLNHTKTTSNEKELNNSKKLIPTTDNKDPKIKLHSNSSSSHKSSSVNNINSQDKNKTTFIYSQKINKTVSNEKELSESKKQNSPASQNKELKVKQQSHISSSHQSSSPNKTEKNQKPQIAPVPEIVTPSSSPNSLTTNQDNQRANKTESSSQSSQSFPKNSPPKLSNSSKVPEQQPSPPPKSNIPTQKSLSQHNLTFHQYNFAKQLYKNNPQDLQKQLNYYQQKYNISKYQQQPFCIVIPTYNNVPNKRYLYNLKSILFQNYSNYRVIVIDDASSDNTGQKILQYAQQQHISQQKLKIVINKQRKMAMPNIKMAAQTFCKPYEIFVIIDGDDQLIGRQVLKFFNSQFQNNNIWLMYSNFIYSDGKLGVSKPYQTKVIETNTFRRAEFVISHLRAFYTKLFTFIKQKDLKDEKGNWLRAANDVAMYMPILQMVHQKHSYVPQIVYWYNANTGLNNHLVKKNEQWYNGKKIKAKHSYKAINQLFTEEQKIGLKQSMNHPIQLKDTSNSLPKAQDKKNSESSPKAVAN